MKQVLTLVACGAIASCVDPGVGSSEQRIIGGEETSDFRGVVSVQFPQNKFTGVMVAPRVVLTVAHGMDKTVGTPAVKEGIVRVGPDWENPEVVAGTLDARMHRYFDVDTFWYYDVGLVLLDQELDVETYELWDDDVPAPLSSIEVVGYGRTTAEVDDYGIKRRATIAPVEASQRRLRWEGSPTTCLGDSGSPVFADASGRVLALHTSGDCDTFGSAMTIAPYLEEFIYPTLDRWVGPCALDGTCTTDGCRTPDPDCDDCGFNDICAPNCEKRDLDCPLDGTFGESCAADSECESGLCVPALNGEAGENHCSLPCSAIPAGYSVCPDTHSCRLIPSIGREELCLQRVEPRDNGAACIIDEQCLSAACSTAGECAAVCSSDSECSADEQCALEAANRRLCVPREEECDGGCRAAAGGRGGSGLWVLLFVAALSVRRSWNSTARR